MNAARHAKKINARRLTVIFTAVIIAGLVVSALAYSIISPSPHGSQGVPVYTPHVIVPSHTSPSPSHTAPSPGRTAPSKPKSPHEIPATPSHPLAQRYTVKQGDNLSVIAVRHHLPSYVPLYNANRAVVGNNPNLIYAGQVLTIPGT